MVNVTLQFTHWDSASLQVISRRLLSPRESVHLSIGTSHFVTVQKETASRVNFMGIDRRMFRTTRLSWRAACDSAPKKIPTQGSVATRIRETCFCRSTVGLQPLARLPGIEPGIAAYNVVPLAFATDQPNAGDKKSESLLCLPSLTTEERGSNPPSHHVLPPAFTSQIQAADKNNIETMILTGL
jgi:hypothetical protein